MITVPKKIVDLLQQNQTFILIVHQKPDGDAIASAVAMGKGLKVLGKNVEYYIDSAFEEKLHIFDEIASFNQLTQKHYDVMLFLDTSTFEYAFYPKNITATIKLVIDHHKSNTFFGDEHFVEVVAACGELVFAVLQALKVPMDEEIAKAIFTAISTDTGSFQFANVTSNTHEVLAEIYKCPVDFSSLSKRLHTTKTFNQMKLFGIAIKNLTLFCHDRISISVISNAELNAYGGAVNVTDDVSNIGMNIDTVILSATFKEVEKDVYRVSLRGKSPYPIDVSTIAIKYHGGGHLRAAGFTFYKKPEALLPELEALIEGIE